MSRGEYMRRGVCIIMIPRSSCPRSLSSQRNSARVAIAGLISHHRFGRGVFPLEIDGG
jgi:hypothetical protein